MDSFILCKERVTEFSKNVMSMILVIYSPRDLILLLFGLLADVANKLNIFWEIF